MMCSGGVGQPCGGHGGGQPGLLDRGGGGAVRGRAGARTASHALLLMVELGVFRAYCSVCASGAVQCRCPAVAELLVAVITLSNARQPCWMLPLACAHMRQPN